MGAMVLEGVPKVPLSDDHGIDRGTPIVRAYIDEFLGQHREAIRGSVLEVGDPRYTARFGAGRVTASTVADIDEANRQASLITDLNEAGALPDESFDCIIPGPGPQRCWHVKRTACWPHHARQPPVPAAHSRPRPLPSTECGVAVRLRAGIR